MVPHSGVQQQNFWYSLKSMSMISTQDSLSLFILVYFFFFRNLLFWKRVERGNQKNNEKWRHNRTLKINILWQCFNGYCSIQLSIKADQRFFPQSPEIRPPNEPLVPPFHQTQSLTIVSSLYSATLKINKQT